MHWERRFEWSRPALKREIDADDHLHLQLPRWVDDVGQPSPIPKRASNDFPEMRDSFSDFRMPAVQICFTTHGICHTPNHTLGPAGLQIPCVL